MIAGIDPFNDDDPMAIYQKILKGKVVFPKGFDKDAKSLVKHLLVADLSKRYGNLKASNLHWFPGAQDVKNHRFFEAINWKHLTDKKIPVTYTPVVKSAGDTSNFTEYPDSEENTPAIKESDDPFLSW